MSGVGILNREMFSEAEAARLLGVPASTLHYWLEGLTRAGKTYQPIIRVEPTGRHAPVTWAEFIEAGLLREYRRALHVPMAELRDFIDSVRARFDTPYPLAHRRPYVAGRQLLSEAQEEAGLDPDLCLVAEVRGQYVLTGAVSSFLQRVSWDGDVVSEWRPHNDPRSPVRINPDARFGRPMVGGISTEAIWEHYEAGEPDTEIAEMFGLSAEQVRWAISYETSARAA